MTQEEKARAYDEALEVMRQWIAPCHTKEQLDTLKKSVFPELAESEEDEKMYARVTGRYTRFEKYYLRALGETEANKVLKQCEEEELWIKNLLEKQKEQKPADLPAGFYVTFPDGKKYYTKEMRCNGMNVKLVEPKLAEWNEEDETRLTNTLIMLKEYAIHHYSKDDVEKSVDWLENRVKFLRPQSKPGWNDGDEEMLDLVIDGVTDAKENLVSKDAKDFCDKEIAWLKSLPERFILQPKQEWSEEGKRKLNRIYEILGQAADEKPFGSSKRIIGDKEEVELQDFLKTLRPSWKPSEQEKGALKTAISVLTEERSFPKAAANLQTILDAFDGKETHKEWKPSKISLEALHTAVYLPEMEFYGGLKDKLCILYEQLKKLGVREEPEYYQHFDPDC